MEHELRQMHQRQAMVTQVVQDTLHYLRNTQV